VRKDKLEIISSSIKYAIMKRYILLLSVMLGFGYLTLTSSKDGPAISGAMPKNRTGSGPSPMGGCAGSTCHGANDNLTTSFNLTFQDLTGIVTKYKPGVSYTGLLYAQKPGASKYGFQITAVKLSDITLQAGTFTGVGTNNHPFSDAGISGIEHGVAYSPQVNATFTWQAPSSNVGPVEFYVVVNATNGNGVADTGDHATTKIFVLTPDPASVFELSQNIHITAYPNPITDKLSLKFEDAEKGTYTISVFDIAGRKMHKEELPVNSLNASIVIRASNWPSGLYLAQIEKEGALRMIPMVKR
jgi:hypothetical protein